MPTSSSVSPESANALRARAITGSSAGFPMPTDYGAFTGGATAFGASFGSAGI
jgi:hypothetical protein